MFSAHCGDLGHPAPRHQVESAFKYDSTNQIRPFKISSSVRKTAMDPKSLKFITDHVTLPVVLVRDKKECLMTIISSAWIHIDIFLIDSSDSDDISLI